MKQIEIKVGRRYIGKVGPLTREVVAIGQQVRPGTALTDGVEFEEDRNPTRKRLYLDTFAQWAHKEVKP